MPFGHFLAQMSDETKWVLYALAALTMAYVVIRPIMRKKTKDPLEKLPSFGLSQQRSVERDMNNLLVELSEMARQVTAQLDTRAAKLEALIEEADRKIAALRALTGEATERTPQLTTHSTLPPPRPAAHEEDQRHSEVYEMADQGLSATEIARRLGRPHGEIELILALRMRR